MIYLFALGIGVVAGLRAMTAPAVVSWAARLGAIDLGGSWLSFLGNAWVPWLLTVLAVGELINDQLPTAPSRKVPVQFGTRILTGALSGAAIGASAGNWALGAGAGALGAVIGTLGGAAARGRLAAAFGRDRPAAVIEDLAAIGGAVLIAASVS